jgi:hypothetical protein
MSAVVLPRIAGIRVLASVLRRARRSFGVVPPQMPVRSFAARAHSRQAERTGQIRQIAFARSAVARSPLAGNQSSGSWSR